MIYKRGKKKKERKRKKGKREKKFKWVFKVVVLDCGVCPCGWDWVSVL